MKPSCSQKEVSLHVGIAISHYYKNQKKKKKNQNRRQKYMAIWPLKIAGFNTLPIKTPTLVSSETLSSNLDNGLNFTRTDLKLKNAVRNLLGSSTISTTLQMYFKKHIRNITSKTKKKIKKELDTLIVAIGKIFQLLIIKALENETKIKDKK